MSTLDLVLGTAQFGSHYGIANKSGQPSQDDATEIIKEAWEYGIREFDTAQIYGDSETILGMSLSYLGLSKEVDIITKLDPLLDHNNVAVLEKAIAESLRRLKVPRLLGVMLHKEDMLPLCKNGLIKALTKFVSLGMIQKIGISVYSPEKAIEAVSTEGIDIIQVPANILDNRFEKAGVFDLARIKKKKVYIRSVFLQGLILMKPDEVPDHISFARDVIEEVDSLARLLKVTRRDLALGYIKEAIPDAKIILGVDLPSQVKDNCISWQRHHHESIVKHVKELFPAVDERILNPAYWLLLQKGDAPL